MDINEEIIDVVIELFNEKGLKFTMDDIAKHLGMSKRTLYTMVKDKDTLFLTTVNYVFDKIKESEKEVAEDVTLDIVEKLRRILIILPKKYEKVDFSKFYRLREDFPKVYAKIENRLETDWDLTFSIMQQAMDQGRVKMIDFPVIQAMIAGTMEYCLSRSVLADHELNYNKAMKNMIEIIFEGILI